MNDIKTILETIDRNEQLDRIDELTEQVAQLIYDSDIPFKFIDQWLEEFSKVVKSKYKPTTLKHMSSNDLKKLAGRS